MGAEQRWSGGRQQLGWCWLQSCHPPCATPAAPRALFPLRYTEGGPIYLTVDEVAHGNGGILAGAWLFIVVLLEGGTMWCARQA